LRDPSAAAERILDAAVSAFGRADILVNSAAVFEADTLASATPELWERQFSVNLQAPFFLCRAFAARLPSDRRGQIVNIIDWRALRPGPDHLIYTLTKAGLAALTRSLAQHLAPQVQVNAIAPGAILPAVEGSEHEFDRLAAQIPLKRTGAPTDVAAALLFLLQSEFITGEIVHVTGGQQL
jgi:pteridine reductase